MIRQIIHIDEEKCTGCGLCVRACHEGAIDLVNGKARLVRENFCDGFGDCLPACPADAITFENREAPAYDEAAVLEAKKAAVPSSPVPQNVPVFSVGTPTPAGMASGLSFDGPSSCLTNWPIQIKLVPMVAPYFQGADLLIAADCTAFASGDFHQRYMKGKITLIGCPKLDNTDYSLKLTEILRNNLIRSITVVRMQVPCCGGLQRAVQTAIEKSGKTIPCSVITLKNDGTELN